MMTSLVFALPFDTCSVLVGNDSCFDDNDDESMIDDGRCNDSFFDNDDDESMIDDGMWRYVLICVNPIPCKIQCPWVKKIFSIILQAIVVYCRGLIFSLFSEIKQ